MNDAEIFTEFLRFGSLLAHQIKNPLTSLTLQIDELNDRVIDGELTKLTKEALDQISHINQMIEQIFCLWKLSLTHEIASFDLGQLANNSINQWSSEFQKQSRDIQIVQDQAVIAVGCAELESQVLDILIDNSLRHGSGRTSISVMRRNEWAVLTIRDEGYGIDEKIKDKLMTYGTTTTGNGIGLVWAKNQVLHDGGQLEITSLNPAVFSLSLRLDPINYGLNQIGNN